MSHNVAITWELGCYGRSHTDHVGLSCTEMNPRDFVTYLLIKNALFCPSENIFKGEKWGFAQKLAEAQVFQVQYFASVIKTSEENVYMEELPFKSLISLIIEMSSTHPVHVWSVNGNCL